MLPPRVPAPDRHRGGHSRGHPDQGVQAAGQQHLPRIHRGSQLRHQHDQRGEEADRHRVVPRHEQLGREQQHHHHQRQSARSQVERKQRRGDRQAHIGAGHPVAGSDRDGPQFPAGERAGVDRRQRDGRGRHRPVGVRESEGEGQPAGPADRQRVAQRVHRRFPPKDPRARQDGRQVPGTDAADQDTADRGRHAEHHRRLRTHHRGRYQRRRTEGEDREERSGRAEPPTVGQAGGDHRERGLDGHQNRRRRTALRQRHPDRHSRRQQPRPAQLLHGAGPPADRPAVHAGEGTEDRVDQQLGTSGHQQHRTGDRQRHRDAQRVRVIVALRAQTGRAPSRLPRDRHRPHHAPSHRFDLRRRWRSASKIRFRPVDRCHLSPQVART